MEFQRVAGALGPVTTCPTKNSGFRLKNDATATRPLCQRVYWRRAKSITSGWSMSTRRQASRPQPGWQYGLFDLRGILLHRTLRVNKSRRAGATPAGQPNKNPPHGNLPRQRAHLRLLPSCQGFSPGLSITICGTAETCAFHGAAGAPGPVTKCLISRPRFAPSAIANLTSPSCHVA